MDLINKTKVVKLRSHLGKYLVADDDRTTVHQSRNAAAHRSIWVVESAHDTTDAARFRNQATGLYLAASDAPFLLGMNGKRVIQSDTSKSGDENRNLVFDWEPIRDRFQIKLKTKGQGRFLRANGGTPPWRNSVTHDDAPASGAAGNWTLWDVEAVELPAECVGGDLSEDDSISGTFPESPLACPWSPRLSMNKSAMDFFTNAKVVRLRIRHGKYLTADEDKETITQDRNGSSLNARWTVEFVNPNPPSLDDHRSVLRLKSCHGKYLTATNLPFLLGMTGRRVLQTLPDHPGSSVEWEPIRTGKQVKLRTCYGNFLRGNGGPPPWRNSVTHDVPHRSATSDWIHWDVEVIEFLERHGPLQGQLVADSDSFSTETSFSSSSDRSSDSSAYSPARSGGRVIYYHIAEEDGTVNDDAGQGYPLTFKGNSIEELTRRLEEDTGIQDIVVCTRSPLNGKLCPLRLQLPPNTVSMRVVAVPSTSVSGV